MILIDLAFRKCDKFDFCPSIDSLRGIFRSSQLIEYCSYYTQAPFSYFFKIIAILFEV